MGEILCRDIMSKSVVSAEYDTEVEELWQLMMAHDIRGIPIVDKERRVIGLLTMNHFLAQVRDPQGQSVPSRLSAFIKRTPGPSTSKPEYAGHLMERNPVTVRDDSHVVDLLPTFIESHITHLLVVDADNRLQGIITPRDLLPPLIWNVAPGGEHGPDA